MSDPISRSAVIDRIAEFLGPKGLDEWEVMVAIREIIENAPAVDAVPVVRCRECVCRSEYGLCYMHGHSVAVEFFCAYGTREKPEKKAEKQAAKSGADICMATGQACSRCVPGPCDRRKEAKV